MKKIINKIKWDATKIITLVSGLLCVLFIILLLALNVLPFKYFLPITLVFILSNIVLIFFSFFRQLETKKSKIIINVISIVLMLIYIFGSFYLFQTIVFIGSFGKDHYKTENYSVIVLKDSVYNSIEDINNKELGMISYETDGKIKAKEHISSKINVTFKDFETPQSLESALLNGEIEIILVEDSYKEMFEEINSEFESLTKIIYTFSVELKNEDISKETDVTKKPFTVYISGIDTYGTINSVSRSDVNMLATINPETNQVLLISIPRDYYVQLHGTTGYKDKLTHAGIYGVDMSVKTLEDLLEVDINYYVKVNFSSVIKIVDVLGGIDVYSEYTFNSYSGYRFYEGYNHMNGAQALDFARTRKAFVTGDRQRGKNQQAVIEALIRKCTSSAIITKYSSLLSSIEGSIQSNITNKQITDLAKYQLDKMPNWSVTSISLDGYDSYEATYSYGTSTAYVMVPYEESVNKAIEAIDQIYGNQLLESTYGEATNVKNPGTTINNSNGSSATNDLNGSEVPSLTLSSNDITVKVGEITKLSAKTNSDSVVSWKSSDPLVATVSDTGVITPVSSGVTTVTASISGITVNCIVRVIEPLDTVLPDNSNGGESVSDNEMNNDNIEADNNKVVGDNSSDDDSTIDELPNEEQVKENE